MKAQPPELPNDPQRLAELARASDTLSETLDALVSIGLPFLWEDVARHPNVSPVTLAKMSPATLETNSGFRAAQAIVQAPGAPADSLQRIASLIPMDSLDGARREHSAYVRLFRALASHPNCPPTALVRVLDAQRLSRQLKVEIAAHTPHREVLQLLAADSSEIVRTTVAGRLGGVVPDSRSEGLGHDA